MNQAWTWTLLLIGAGAFATWRGISHLRLKRPAFGIAMLFMALFCFYEGVMRLIEMN